MTAQHLRMTVPGWPAGLLALTGALLLLLAVANRQPVGQGVGPALERLAEARARTARDAPPASALSAFEQALGDRVRLGWERLRAEAPPVLAPVVAPLPDQAPVDVVLAGRFEPVADTDAPGAVRFAAAEVRFDGAGTLSTAPERIASGAEAWAPGRRFGRTLRARRDAQIEIRRVVSTEPGADTSALCGGDPVAWIALLPRQERLDLMLFRQGPAPGPAAADSQLCGVYAYQR